MLKISELTGDITEVLNLYPCKSSKEIGKYTRKVIFLDFLPLKSPVVGLP